MRDLQPVSIGGIEFDALINGEETYNAEVPSYPVDNGFSVSDNVAIGAMEITMVLVLSATPVTWLATHGSGENRIRTVCDQLLDKYKEREPLTVVTRDKTFDNMVISSISITKSEEAVLSREIQITLRQVTVTSSAETEIPAKLAKSGTTKSNSGMAGTTYASGKSDGSSSGSISSASDVADVVSGSSSSGSSGSSGSGSGSKSSSSSSKKDNRSWAARTYDTAKSVGSNVADYALNWLGGKFGG